MKKRPSLLALEDFPPEAQQQRSLEKRARLKEAALTLFLNKGYGGTSIDNIAEEAGLAVGTFYQHFRSKRQLLIALMEELLEKLSGLNLQPQAAPDPLAVLHALLSNAFAHDLHYLGAYRAWQEAVLSDTQLAQKQREIQHWTTGRLANLFDLLQSMPGARTGVDVRTLALVMDQFFWSLLAQAALMRKPELNRWLDSTTHLIYHALFTD